MDRNETASFPPSSNNGGSTSSKETDDDCLRDHRPVFMFQPDIKENAKKLEPHPEMDLELRLCTRPSDCNGNGPVASPPGKQMPPAVHRDEASCCWEPAGSVLPMTLDNRLCNSIAASHSSVASNSIVGVCSLGAEVPKSAFNDRLHCQFYGCGKAARGKSAFCIRHGGGRRCVVSGCTRAARGKTTFCLSHGGGRRCAVSGCKRHDGLLLQPRRREEMWDERLHKSCKRQIWTLQQARRQEDMCDDELHKSCKRCLWLLCPSWSCSLTVATKPNTLLISRRVQQL